MAILCQSVVRLSKNLTDHITLWFRKLLLSKGVVLPSTIVLAIGLVSLIIEIISYMKLACRSEASSFQVETTSTTTSPCTSSLAKEGLVVVHERLVCFRISL